MNFKDVLNKAVEKGYEAATNALADLSIRLEAAIDALPDAPGAVDNDEVDIATKRNDIARVAEANGYSEAASMWRDSTETSDTYIAFIWNLLLDEHKSKPEKEPEFDAQSFLEYLRKTSPTMAKVYEQTLKGDAGVEGEKNPWLDDNGNRNT